MTEQRKKTKQKAKSELTFKYVHPDGLRDCYVNGAWGGLTPRKEIHMHLYSERHPIPKTATHKVKKNGSLEKSAKIELGADVVRLVQASVIMNINTAISLRDWLTKTIESVVETEKEG